MYKEMNLNFSAAAIKYFKKGQCNNWQRNLRNRTFKIAPHSMCFPQNFNIPARCNSSTVENRKFPTAEENNSMSSKDHTYTQKIAAIKAQS
ncbi:hypothetical protein PoB_003169300 [Plakobranchus ocellatus]|uniref:Uncharacterized protein n=1 Tax=Plakobranchus ocellatus TaxID=259542 RepID=A0AAV4AF68_9GAST|nr:hypothetical protein PoB_003169300 [Plakobranchus ocellatus]